MSRLRSPEDRAQRAKDAARYRKDGSSRVAQRRAARLLKASPAAESGYQRALVGIMAGVHNGISAAVASRLPPKETRHDAAVTFPPAGMMQRLFAYLRSHVTAAFATMAKTVNADNKEALALLGISPATMGPGIGALMVEARERSIARMQAAAQVYAEQVNALLDDPEVDREDLPALLEERGAVAQTRAAFVARDEVLRTNAGINKARQVAAGVARYRWSTSKDECVRPMHAELEGEAFTWDDPPVTNEEGDTNAPGEDWQCRCVPLPIVEELEEGYEPPELPDEDLPEDEEPAAAE